MHAQLKGLFEEFSFLLKKRVCLLVIKLFSPNIKYKQFQNLLQQQKFYLNSGQQQQQNAFSSLSNKNPFFPISISRLLRIVSVIIQNRYADNRFGDLSLAAHQVHSPIY